MEEKLISFDIKADFGFLKKPDINEGIYLTYNCLHKPALLGILGAVIGLKGHYHGHISGKKIPEYFEKLKNIKVGIQPIDSLKGNFSKTIITYNNSVGYANLDGGNLIVSEQTLLKPSFRIYLLINFSNEYERKVYEYIRNVESEFIPYLGKNDFQLWWEKENVFEYKFSKEKFPKSSYSIENLFVKPEGKAITQHDESHHNFIFDFNEPLSSDFFIFFERLPIGFDEKTNNYSFASFVYTNKKLSNHFIPKNLYYLDNEKKYIQLN